MTDLINNIVKEGCIPDDWRNSTMVSVHQGKGDPFVCWSYRSIKLLGQPINVLERVLERFQRLPHTRGGTAQRKIFDLANWSQLIHPGPSSSRSSFFMESSQLYAATLTHYSTEPLTTGPVYDPLLLLLALVGDVHPNP